MPQQLIDTLNLSMGRRCETCLEVRRSYPPTKDRMFLAGHPSQGCFGLQSHCAPCYFFNQASFYPSDFSFRPKDVYSYTLGYAQYFLIFPLEHPMNSRLLETYARRNRDVPSRAHLMRVKE
ncbi:transposable element Tcb2 transposase [Trichonephila clavipes]|nr:transposable element Tcb2 transposase [Trichonephila clavipes]